MGTMKSQVKGNSRDSEYETKIQFLQIGKFMNVLEKSVPL